jgi:putative endonuclease
VRNRGRQAELYAGKWLQKQKLSILEFNFHSRWGEIDIVAMDNNTLCFIEVRYRKSSCYGSAVESVTTSKQQRIIKSARAYLHLHKAYNNHSARFDVISMSGDLDNPDIDWYKDAFLLNSDF